MQSDSKFWDECFILQFFKITYTVISLKVHNRFLNCVFLSKKIKCKNVNDQMKYNVEFVLHKM